MVKIGTSSKKKETKFKKKNYEFTFHKVCKYRDIYLM